MSKRPRTEPARSSGRPTRDQGAAGSAGPDATVTADAQLPKLDESSLRALAEVGRRWGPPEAAPDPRRASLPLDPQLRYRYDSRHERGAFVQVHHPLASGQDELEATQAGGEDTRLGRVGHHIRRLVIGPPLRSSAVAAQRMGKLLALPVLSPDALSSVAYGPEAMMAILVAAGSAELKLSLPIGAVLVALMVSVGMGYRQVIRAYPNGGGSYIVASDSLGPRWGLLAGAGLIVDYILTVAVSVAAGVAAITSAIPAASPWAVPIGLVVIVLLVLANLRGVGAAGAAFALPTYMFIVAIALITVVGVVDAGSHGFAAVPPATHGASEALGLLLILRAFASGATAMTGIEVISNAVPVFKPPEADNARRTLTVMLGLLVTMFIGVLVVAHLDGASPGSETVLSQIAHRSVGGGLLYGYVQLSTTLILLIAANSAANGFPRLLYFMARDDFIPHAFLHMGDRLAFSVGIVVLAVPAAFLYAIFGGQTEPLIPLYAIGVFVAFTLAQSAMVAHWRQHHASGWRRGLLINLLGAILSGAVVLIALVTKFTSGAWIVVLLIPMIIVACLSVHRHYQLAQAALYPPAEDAAPPSTDAGARTYEGQDAPAEIAHLAVVPVAALDRSALRALAYAASLNIPTLAVHVSPSDQEADRFHRYWQDWGDHLPLEVLVSPYRTTLAPLANYIEALHLQRPELTLTVVVPQVVVRHSWQRTLHSRTGQRLRRALNHQPGIVITSIPFHLPN